MSRLLARRPRRSDMRYARRSEVHLERAPKSKQLFHALDHGQAVPVAPDAFINPGREPGWGPHLESFLARNREGFRALSLEPRITSTRDGTRLELQPGEKAGAIPLRSAATGKIAGGFVVAPRFGWTGVGSVLSKTGWGSGPEFLIQPLVPGSGREVPPWVLAGPVLQRVAEMLRQLRPGYRERTEVRSHPRGQIQWQLYVSQQLPAGRWHQLPCRFSELESDSRLKQVVRWVLERIKTELIVCGGADPVARLLAAIATQLLDQVMDVQARRPNPGEFDRSLNSGSMMTAALRDGLQAIGWIAEERGLGGGRSSDGLSWALPLDKLWERYVESVYRVEAAKAGATVRVGRLGETTVPLTWSGGSRHRTMSHLVPDVVLLRRDVLQIVDAKYKAHFADLDATRWSEFSDEAREAHRADIHQVLAYAAALGDGRDVHATLVYPVSHRLAAELVERRLDSSTARLAVGQRQITLELRAMSFG